MFKEEPHDVEIVLSTTKDAQFTCQYVGGENENELKWTINSTSYHLTELPANYYTTEQGHILHVMNISDVDNINNTRYQCRISVTDRERNKQCAYHSRTAKLIIKQTCELSN